MDYPNPLTRLELLDKAPPRLHEYRLLTDSDDDTKSRRYEIGDNGTNLYDAWWREESHFVSMFRFQHEVLRFVATDSNNSINSIDAYVRSVAVLRDFAERFAAMSAKRIRDWRMFVTMSSAHFAQCLYFVKDTSVRNVARQCMNLVVRDPYTVGGHTPDSVDPVTAYRLANAWILARRADGHGDWMRNDNYDKMLGTLSDKSSPRWQWLYYEPLAVDAVVRLRDHGRLLQGRIPFYGDLWHKYVYIRNVRKMDNRVDRLVANTADFACLRLLVHTQVRYTCFGLFGPGVVVPSFWLWPITEVGLAVIPSIGLLRMYEQRYSWSVRIMKEDMPFYTYRPGHFDPLHMHVFSQNRMFVLLGDNDVASRINFQPGCIVLDNETEHWVLNNCEVSQEAGDLIALYPLRASGTVMATRSIGLMVQRYEMFRGLFVEEWVLLDRHNKRVYLHTVVRNDTDRSATYYTSSRPGGTVRRILPGTTATIYAFADFDDSQLTTRLLCQPMDIQAFFGQSQEESLYTSFLDNGKIYYALSAEDETDHVYVISRDDMIDIPERLVVRQMEYRFNRELNQYVNITPRIRPHSLTSSSSSSSSSSKRRKRETGGDSRGNCRDGGGRSLVVLNKKKDRGGQRGGGLSCRDGECRGGSGGISTMATFKKQNSHYHQPPMMTAVVH